MRLKGFAQRALGALRIHRVHHTNFSYGWVFMPLQIGVFPAARGRAGDATQGVFIVAVHPRAYHDCTKTGRN